MNKKIINLVSEKNRRNPYEICVLCNTKTNIRKDQDIGERYGYIEGVGQLCYECYKKLKNE